MPTYFILETVTREGMMTVDEAPARAAGVVDLAASYGLTLQEWFFTTGSSDFLMKLDAPDEEKLAVFVMALRRSGNVTVEVLRAYEPTRWAELVGRL